MTRRFLIGLMAITVGCGGSGTGDGTGTAGTSATGSAGTNGGTAGTNGGTAGASATGTAGTSATGTAGTSATGTGGSATGTGGSVTGTGGSATGTGGSATGTGGSATGTGGSGTGGSATGTAGRGGNGGNATGNGGRGGSAGGTGGGSAGRGGTTGSGGQTQLPNQSVTERNKNPSRDGHFVQPGLTKTAVAGMVATPGFTGTFTGAMTASPLYWQNGPNGVGLLIAATTGNDVFALNENTGAQVWMKNIGSSPQDSGAGCGGVHPIGIESTGVIDAATGTLFVAGAIGSATISKHEIHALDLMTGMEKTGWPVDAATAPASGSLTFMPQPQNQRSALSLVNGVVYVAYGGHVGDCGPYHGWVLGINAANPAMKGGWATGGQGEGIWAAGGMASDGTGVFAATGNRTGGGSSTHQDSEQVTRITGMGTRADTWYPSRWMAMDTADADVGSVNPVYVELAGATPSKMVLQVSKDGHLYILDAANLGGSAAPKVDYMFAASGMSIHGTPIAYKTATAQYFVVNTTSGAQGCPGNVTGRAMVALKISAASPPVASIAWCSAISGNASTAPIVTTTDGTNNAVVWFINNANTLKALDGDTGTQLYNSTNTCTNVQRWTSPIALNNKIVVGGNAHLCSWSLP